MKKDIAITKLFVLRILIANISKITTAELASEISLIIVNTIISLTSIRISTLLPFMCCLFPFLVTISLSKFLATWIVATLSR